MATLPAPRRLLLLGTSKSGKLTLLKNLTGTLPATLLSTPTAPHAGLSHTLPLKTQYYTAEIPIWIEELPSTPSDLEDWTTSYLSEGAKEVLEALGGFVVTFRAGVTAAPLLHAVKRVVDKQLGGRGWDGVCVAVCMPGEEAEVARELLDAAEDACLLHGFEYVEYLDGRRGVRNDYGEPSGVDRVLEALEANDWSGGGDLGLSDEEEEEGEDGLKPIGDEIEREMFGLRSAIYANQEGEGDDIDEEKEVEKLEAAMAKMMMLKEMGEDVSKEERKKIAAKAIADLMRT